jgi:hypothetical protein
VVSEVIAVAVVDGATVVIGPPAMAMRFGARWRRSWSCSHPRPSMASRTVWRAPSTTSGIHDGRRPPMFTSVGTTFEMQAPA